MRMRISPEAAAEKPVDNQGVFFVSANLRMRALRLDKSERRF